MDALRRRLRGRRAGPRVGLSALLDGAVAGACRVTLAGYGELRLDDLVERTARIAERFDAQSGAGSG